MLLSLALIFLTGMIFAKLFNILKLPSIIGLLISGMLLGPFCFNLLDESILLISNELRRIALIIILARAGMNLDFEQLKKAGNSTLFLSFLPALFEIAATVFFAPIILGVSFIDALLIGCVIAAVSPAVIVPRMIDLINKGYGKQKAIPEMIMSASSIDDIFVIILFTITLNIKTANDFSSLSLLRLPTSIILGAIFGVLIGFLLAIFFEKFHLRDTSKVILLLSISFIAVTVEDNLTASIAFSGLLFIMVMTATLKYKKKVLTSRLQEKFSKLWVCSEMLLFVLVGASVDISYSFNLGFIAVGLILLVLIFRIFGVFISLIFSKLNKKEKLFVAVSYIPKATVQAAIGAIPLSLGLEIGDVVLTLAVLSIILTAPLGAFLIDGLYTKCLEH